jgi:SAM-dependent methyltransferase
MVKEKNYMNIIKHYESCLVKYGDSHKGVDWPNKEDAEKRFSVMLDVIKDKNGRTSMLDFGCGSAHLYEYILKNNLSHIEYSGLEISKSFYEVCIAKFPETKFYHMDMLDGDSLLPDFDYTVLNGVFTEKVNLSFEEMFEYFKLVVKNVYKKSQMGMAFNVMSTYVDREREDLFHLPIDLLTDFLVTEVTRSFVIRNDYGLYEYTVYLYR